MNQQTSPPVTDYGCTSLRDLRRYIAAKFSNDPHRLEDHLREMEKLPQYAQRIVREDEVKTRMAAMQNLIPIMTLLRGADTALRAIKSLQGGEVQVRALQEYHK